MDAQLDRQGRFVLPSYLRDYAGIGDDVVIIGANTRLEIWAQQSWLQTVSKVEEEGALIAENLASLGHLAVPLWHLPRDTYLYYWTPSWLACNRARAACTSTARWAAAGTRRRFWRPALPDGGCLAWTLTRRPWRARRRRWPSSATSAAWSTPVYVELAEVARAQGLGPVDGVLLDLGLSSYQLADAGARLQLPDRRRLWTCASTRRGGTTAADLLATLPEEELANIIYLYGEERRSRALARAIVHERVREPITDDHAAGRPRARGSSAGGPGGIHPATRTFQALRIAVNGELEALEAVLPQAVEVLRPGGRAGRDLVSLAGGPDGQAFLQARGGRLHLPALGCRCASAAISRVWRLVTKKPVVADGGGDGAEPAQPQRQAAGGGAVGGGGMRAQAVRVQVPTDGQAGARRRLAGFGVSWRCSRCWCWRSASLPAPGQRCRDRRLRHPSPGGGTHALGDRQQPAALSTWPTSPRRRGSSARPARR